MAESTFQVNISYFEQAVVPFRKFSIRIHILLLCNISKLANLGEDLADVQIMSLFTIKIESKLGQKKKKETENEHGDFLSYFFI